LCGTDNQVQLVAEIALHFPGLKYVSEPAVWVFPKVLVCMDCGSTEFTVPQRELKLLLKAEGAAGR